MDAPKLKGQQTTLTIDQVIISCFLIPPFFDQKKSNTFLEKPEEKKTSLKKRP
ncbi:hypothetical protein [Cyclobacterium xiamenense]|uniref:hypothetical protein n=1 Tax=Cyclobacterium xiamenense TaxID=1297121 RepID=UPI0012B9AB83|nr:hypothetical protein [Cyclobacterium xiamenense]